MNSTNWEVDGTIGSRGSKPNQFEILSSVACLDIGVETFLITTEIRNQRLQIINYNNGKNIICTSKGMGPLPGQFHNPVSVTCHLPKHFVSDKYSLHAQLVPDWYLGPCESKQMMLQLEKRNQPGSLVMCQRMFDASTFEVAYMLDGVRVHEETIRRQGNGRVFVSSPEGVTASASSIWDVIKQWPTVRKVTHSPHHRPSLIYTSNVLALRWMSSRALTPDRTLWLLSLIKRIAAFKSSNFFGRSPMCSVPP